MYLRQRQAAGQTFIRELPLLEGEQIEERFVPDDGLVPDVPLKGELLVLTNQRIVSFAQNNGHKETLLAPLGELQRVSVRANTRGLKNLSQGLILILIGILVYFIIGYVLDGVAIALALGLAIVVVGILFIARYLIWEDEGSISFHVGGWEVRFPYKSNKASLDVYKLINRFFELKLNTNSHHPSQREGIRFNSSRPPFSQPLSGNSPYDN